MLNLQLEVDEDCKHLLTLNTHRGLYRVNRMVYGIASAPAIWQWVLEQILQGLPKVACILDDMIITGSNDEDHLKNVGNVLKRLKEYGVRLNLTKCEFMKDRITFFGHGIDCNGQHMTEKLVKAIVDAPRPENVSSPSIHWYD
uniref:uncharacterized protein K02A2.6-like n=1 Tax=Styela clava TaxID=7725 RepID=UPI001939CD82|nr:uncharacterized protein K02A2.6-like [Styela clava]